MDLSRFSRPHWLDLIRMLLIHQMSPSALAQLARELVTQSGESEWVEFKENNADPQKIGENISAISNSAALLHRGVGYIVWGVRNSDHEIVGTTFRPKAERVRAQELENWLVTQLEPRIDVRIHEGEVDGKQVVVFEVQADITGQVQLRSSTSG